MSKINMIKMSLQIALDLGLENTNEYRTSHYVERKITEELGEMAEEYKKMKNKLGEGKDGIRGEAVDFLISVIDLFFLYQLKEGVEPKTVMEKLFNILDLESDLSDINPEFFSKAVLVESLVNLTDLNGRLALCANIRQGLSYKSAETFGVSHIDEEIHKIMLEMVENALYVFKADLVLNVFKTDNVSTEQYETTLSEIWANKIGKWRKSRSI